MPWSSTLGANRFLKQVRLERKRLGLTAPAERGIGVGRDGQIPCCALPDNRGGDRPPGRRVSNPAGKFAGAPHDVTVKLRDDIASTKAHAPGGTVLADVLDHSSARSDSPLVRLGRCHIAQRDTDPRTGTT